MMSFPTMGQTQSLSRFLSDLNHGPAELWQLILVLPEASWGSTFGGPATLQCSDLRIGAPQPSGKCKGRPAESGQALSSASGYSGKIKTTFSLLELPRGF